MMNGLKEPLKKPLIFRKNFNRYLRRLSKWLCLCRFIWRHISAWKNRRYPDEELEKKAEAFIKQFKEGLLKFNSILGIENFGSIYEPCFFIFSNPKMMKFKMDIKVSTESIEEDYQIFDKALLSLRPYFIQNNCDYEQDFSAGYVRKEGKMRLIIYKLLEE